GRRQRLSLDRLPRRVRNRAEALAQHAIRRHRAERPPARPRQPEPLLDERELRPRLSLIGADYYLDDPRLVLVPIEHLGPDGMSAELAVLLSARVGWSTETIRLFDAGFACYWTRGMELARRTRGWVRPRRRHVAVVRDPLSVRPYVQLLNTSAWLLYECDLD